MAMAPNAPKKDSKKKEVIYSWEGVDKKGKKLKGEMAAPGENVVANHLRRQGIVPGKIKKLGAAKKKKITDKDITLFTRQLATMLKSGVPLLQAFEIVAKGHSNPSVQRLLLDIKADVETGSSLTTAFSRFPLYFDSLFCNLVNAGEQAGILEGVLDRLATYKEKTLALKAKIKKALFYPTAIIVAAFLITAVIMIFVIPAFKELFTGFGANLPLPTLIVMSISDFFVDYWYAIFGVIGGSIYGFIEAKKRSKKLQDAMDRISLKLPVFGEIMEKATVARWTRTLSTMFAAGVPLVEALGTVGGAAGNVVYSNATKVIQNEVSTGTSLTNSMQGANLFPNMVIQMVQIGEESGALDSMLSKVADYYEREVDDAVDALASLMEPIIMVVLGTLIGGLVVAMYLPIFKLGSVVGG